LLFFTFIVNFLQFRFQNKHLRFSETMAFVIVKGSYSTFIKQRIYFDK
jgi:hypothetical protein